jgi:hypothetical protein
MNQFALRQELFVKEVSMAGGAASDLTLSSWWRRGVVLLVVSGLAVLIWLAAKTYTDAPPIPPNKLRR